VWEHLQAGTGFLTDAPDAALRPLLARFMDGVQTADEAVRLIEVLPPGRRRPTHRCGGFEIIGSQELSAGPVGDRSYRRPPPFFS